MKKSELLLKIQESRGKIEALARSSSLPLEESGSTWTLKQVLAHLAFWEHATLRVRSGLTTAEQLRNVHKINEELLAKTRTRAAEEVLREFNASGEMLIYAIDLLSDEDLQGPAPWGDDRTLLEHIADDTYVHYEEHS